MSGTDATGDYGVAQVLSGALRTGGVKRWKAEAERLRAALSSVHLALGESPDSDDASLGEVVARHLRERDERIGEMAQALATAKAGAVAAEIERDDLKARLTNRAGDLANLRAERDAALAQVEAERSKVGALCEVLRDLLAHPQAVSVIARARDLLAPSPGTDHEDRQP